MSSWTDLDVFPLCLGGNVFGWNADRDTSFAVLDAYAEAGGNFIDTADSYTHTIPGNSGGESETIIGEWLESRGNRDSMIVATKVFGHPQRPGLSAKNIRAAAEDSLRRLRTDRIDLYYAHRDDTQVPLSETLGAFDELIQAGVVGAIGASNHTPARLREALATSEREGLARYVVVQDHYNLVKREEYEGGIREVAAEHGLVCAPYFALAMGFLTGKYRRQNDDGGGSQRAPVALSYLDERGQRVLDALDAIAETHDTTVAAASLAWLAAQPTVVAPIASARTPEQVADLLPMATLQLTEPELQRLTDASS